jgi:hypothetical protein
MRRVSSWTLTLAGLLLCTTWYAQLAAQDHDDYAATVRPLLQSYCWDCHGQARHKGELNLQAYATAADLQAHGEVLTRVEKRVARHEMPPEEARQPSDQERATLVRWLAATMPQGQPVVSGDPGAVVMAHLTPTQYERVIHDLTGMRLPVASQLPRDGGAGEGFDNVGSAQDVTSLHVQAFLTTATQIVSHARVLPGMPLEWKQESSSYEARSSEELFAILASDMRGFVTWMWQRQYRDHMAALAPVMPTPDQWGRAIAGYTQQGWSWLVPYLHGAWQYRYRAQLGHPDWTVADTANAYQVPLRPEILNRMVQVLNGKSWNMYWNQLVTRWQALPPPPVADAVMRAEVFKQLTWVMRHMYIRNHDTTAPPEYDVLLPVEVDPRAYLKQPQEDYYLMQNEGRHPFRFQLKGRLDLYLVTTDAGDGADDDVMIWEHGVITRDGHEEPWTSVTVKDRQEAPVAWGSHPMGPAAKLPLDAIAVHAPAVLHLTFPAGTTAFRVDARADPVYAKNGSMQTLPFSRPPTDDETHFAIVRYVFGAPGSSRQRAIMAASEVCYDLGWSEVCDPWNLLPKSIRGKWANLHDKSIAGDWGDDNGVLGSPPPSESEYGSGFPHGWPPIDHFWKGTSTFLLPYASDQEKKHLSHLIDLMLACSEARDTLGFFLAQQKIPCENPAAAMRCVPTTLPPDLEKRFQLLHDAAIQDEERLQGCARTTLTDFATRAWRTTPAPGSIQGFLQLYQLARDEGLCYEACMKRALVGVLTSPYFLYREEPSHQSQAPYGLDGRALADRLAAVLWGSIPDAELSQAAASGSLTTTPGLTQQIERMRTSPRALALAEEFAGQAFLFEGFDTFSGPDAALFPQFTPAIRAAMYQECLSFFGNLFTQDRPLTDIIDCTYTYLNQDLADFYGIQGVAGPAFRQVTVNDQARGGILGMGAFLVSSSLPLRTSPIRRGNWILSHLLGTPPPAPPAVVPALSQQETNDAKLGIVEQMKLHRNDARCMSCHERIDPLGIPLESFDAIGRHRSKLQDGGAITDSETTVDGKKLQGFSSLKAFLCAEPQRGRILRNLCEKFVGYALGRSLIPADQALVDQALHDLAAQGWRSSVLIQDVLTSPEFTRRREEAEAALPTPGQSQETP